MPGLSVAIHTTVNCTSNTSRHYTSHFSIRQ